jgi:predicted MPP superfamily phosphohydrolase
VGSLYSRVGGAVGATLYVSRGAGVWAAVAGV